MAGKQIIKHKEIQYFFQQGLQNLMFFNTFSVFPTFSIFSMAGSLASLRDPMKQNQLLREAPRTVQPAAFFLTMYVWALAHSVTAHGHATRVINAESALTCATHVV